MALAIAIACGACGGGGDSGGDAGGGGGGGGGGDAETLPLDIERCESVDYEVTEEGMSVDEDSAVAGCIGTPARPGTTFTDDDVRLTYVSGELTTEPSSDPVNDTTFIATVVIEIDNGSDASVDAGDYEVYLSTPGDTLDTCPVEPSDAEVAAGESLEVTTTCSIDLMTAGQEADTSGFIAELNGPIAGLSAGLELQG
jgi:hypothetical protein